MIASILTPELIAIILFAIAAYHRHQLTSTPSDIERVQTLNNIISNSRIQGVGDEEIFADIDSIKIDLRRSEIQLLNDRYTQTDSAHIRCWLRYGSSIYTRIYRYYTILHPGKDVPGEARIELGISCNSTNVPVGPHFWWGFPEGNPVCGMVLDMTIQNGKATGTLTIGVESITPSEYQHIILAIINYLNIK